MQERTTTVYAEMNPEHVPNDAICVFWFRGKWNPSPALIAKRAKRIRDTKKEGPLEFIAPTRSYPYLGPKKTEDADTDFVRESRKAYNGLAKAILLQAIVDIEDCIDFFDRGGRLSLSHTGTKRQREDTVALIKNAATAIGWLMSGGDELEKSMGVSFSEICQYEGCNPAIVRKTLFDSFGKFPNKMMRALNNFCDTTVDSGAMLCG